MAENSALALNEPPKALDSFLSLEFGRQIGLMIGLAASVALGVGLALWLVLEKDYAPLYESLDRIDGNEVITLLQSQQIDYRIDRATGALLVDSSKIHEARLTVAAAGMPVDSSIGFELLEGEQPLGTSQFMENARFRRSLEGELARTIASISAIRAARVHLAIPRSTVFLREGRQPEASVFVEKFQGMSLADKQVRAIANLVASSVPELVLENVTVVDQNGSLLSNFDEAGIFAEAEKQLQYRRNIEATILSRLNNLLEPVLGRDRFRAELSLELDFTQSEQTAEIYNPDLPAVRSEQTTSEQLQNTGQGEAGGVPGALANQPAAEDPAEGDAAEQPLRTRVLETRNFELDRTISHTRQQLGAIRKITVAVAIDDKKIDAAEPGDERENADTDNTATAQNWTQDELDRLAVLVQNAVGYDVTRGDRVSVINTPFYKEEIADLVEPTVPIWELPIVWTVAKILGGVLAFLSVVFMVLRPAMRGLTENSRRIQELEYKHQQALQAVNDMAQGAEAEISENGEVTVSGKRFLPSPGDQLDSQLNKVRDMVSNEPERVAQVIQGWTAQNE